jgi:hypothetical protein
LGWAPVKPKKREAVNKQICSFTVGVEKYLAMEALFNPKVIGFDVIVF